MSEPAIELGDALAWCAFAVAEDPLRRSPRALRARLSALSDRHAGARRTREIPAAYIARYGAESAAALTRDRLLHGGYRSRGVLPDALAIAAADTDVGVWALDAARVTGAPRLAGRTIVDDAGELAPLFAEPDSVTRATRRLILYAVRAPGVPDLAVVEALHAAWDAAVTA
ncbi:MAG TPA: hypothetical protein VNS09_04135 [Solirubrobacter sp.]|nr:hypothetical protein [Solirubrobacter sp.]